MSKINYQITESNSSLVLKRIAQILTLEFNAQIALGNTFLPTKCCYDLAESVNEGDLPFVSVSWLKFESNIDEMANSQYLNHYYIDVKCIGYDVVRKTIAIIRKILKSQQYYILDFPYGIISETTILEAGITQEETNRSTQNAISGGLLFRCNVLETNDEPVPVDINSTIYESLLADTGESFTLKNNY